MRDIGSKLGTHRMGERVREQKDGSRFFLKGEVSPAPREARDPLDPEILAA